MWVHKEQDIDNLNTKEADRSFVIPKPEFFPLGDHILVQAEDISTTKSGIYMGEMAKELPAKGAVVCLPSLSVDSLPWSNPIFIQDWHKIEIQLRIWDTIYFPKHAWEEIIINNVKYISLRYYQVIGKTNETLVFPLHQSSAVENNTLKPRMITEDTQKEAMYISNPETRPDFIPANWKWLILQA